MSLKDVMRNQLRMCTNILRKLQSYSEHLTDQNLREVKPMARECLQGASHCARTFPAFAAQNSQPCKGKENIFLKIQGRYKKPVQAQS